MRAESKGGVVTTLNHIEHHYIFVVNITRGPTMNGLSYKSNECDEAHKVSVFDVHKTQDSPFMQSFSLSEFLTVL